MTVNIKLQEGKKAKCSSLNHCHIKYKQAGCSNWMGHVWALSLPRLVSTFSFSPVPAKTVGWSAHHNLETDDKEVKSTFAIIPVSGWGLEFRSFDFWSHYVFNHKTTHSPFQFWVSSIKLDSTRFFVSSRFYNSKSNHGNNGLATPSLVCLVKDTHFYIYSVLNSFSLGSSVANWTQT